MRTGSQDAYVLLSHRTLSDSIAKHWKTDEAKAIDVKLHIQICKRMTLRNDGNGVIKLGDQQLCYFGKERGLMFVHQQLIKDGKKGWRIKRRKEEKIDTFVLGKTEEGCNIFDGMWYGTRRANPYKEGVDDTYGQREEVEEKCKAREMKRERRSEEKDKEKEKEDMGMEESKPKLYVFKSSYKPE
ncbi:hypothetical protein KSS87_020527 [Heliosperma pusillum]|nr:hypothetical protein KSS87_020527 [Heliosperma pusillum]